VSGGDSLRGQAITVAVAAIGHALRFERGLARVLEAVLRHGADLDDVAAAAKAGGLEVTALQLREVMDRWSVPDVREKS
jgi:hypothetical protein